MDLSMLTTSEAAKLLRFHQETIRRFIREGKIKAYRVGKHFLIKEEDVKKFVEKSTRVNTQQQGNSK